MTNGMKVSDRLAAIPMSGIRKMFDLAKPDSINLGLGEPDLEPPKEAIEGMNAAAVDGKNKYSPTAGIPELRDAIAERFSRYNPGLSGRNVIVTPSGSTALLEMTQAFVDPGDEVLVPSPGFVIYAPHASLAGGKPVEYRLSLLGIYCGNAYDGIIDGDTTTAVKLFQEKFGLEPTGEITIDTQVALNNATREIKTVYDIRTIASQAERREKTWNQ